MVQRGGVHIVDSAADNSCKKKWTGCRAILAVYTLLAVMINVAVVSATIFCQTRYMIYNMPLFYISLVLLPSSFDTKPAVCAGSKGMV